MAYAIRPNQPDFITPLPIYALKTSLFRTSDFIADCDCDADSDYGFPEVAGGCSSGFEALASPFVGTARTQSPKFINSSIRHDQTSLSSHTVMSGHPSHMLRAPLPVKSAGWMIMIDCMWSFLNSNAGERAASCR